MTETQYTALGDVQKIRAGYRSAAGVDTLTDQATYAYDDFGRIIEQTDALGHTTRWVYDEHGQPIRRESPNGHIVEWEYDHSRNGLLTRQTAKLNETDPALHVTDYAYDALGQLTGVDAPEVSYDYTYDNAQRLATVTDNRGNKTLTYRHSPGGLLDSLEDNEGWRQDFLYDAVGRLSAIQAPGGGQANFVFDAGGRLRETAMPNGYRSLYRYSAGGELEELVNRAAGGAEVSRHTYSYDAQGRRKTHLEAIAGTSTDYSYQYDTLDRLREVRTQNGATLAEAYAYDAYGNRRERTADGSVRRYLYDAAQQLQQVRSGSDTGTMLAGYGYDEAGNQTQRTGLILGYDALDRLVSASGTGFATETYRYDHQGRRIETASGGTPKRFVYAGQELLSEYGADWSAAQAHYAYAGLDRPLLRNTPSGNAYYHADGLGSIAATSNAAGSITASARYDAFGQTINKTGMIPRYGYAGREPDQSGLIYYRARYYDPGFGRFGQRDPAGFADGINPYAYVGNNPVSFSDPLGLMKAVPSIWTASTYPGSKSSNSGIGAQVASFGLGFTPAGVALDFATLLTGRDVITNEPVSRGWAIAGIIPGVSELRKTAKAVDGAMDVARVANSVPTVTFSRSRAPGLAQNFDNAVANGAPTQLNRASTTARDANRREALRGQSPAPAGQSLDEYPFACSTQGGCGSFVRAVPVSEQNYQGGF